MLLILQVGVIFCSLATAWLLRFEFHWPNPSLFWTALPILLIARLAALPLFNLTHDYWRYTGINDALDLLKAILTGSAAFLVIVRYGLGLESFPLSVYVLEALLSFTLLGGLRVGSRVLVQTTRSKKDAKRLLLVGAGHAAQMIIRETQTVETGYHVVGCVDDDPRKRGMRILGVPMLGPVEAVPALVPERGIEEVLIAIPSATPAQLRRLMAICQDASASCRTVPSVAELVAGRVTLQQAREVSAEDLLGRSPVELDLHQVREQVRDRVILVTGAAGSIGSELCRQISRCSPRVLVCVDQDETAMFHLQHELARHNGHTRQVFCVADCCHQERIHKIFLAHRVEAVFHAAAYKHVPMMEDNVEEAVNNNIFGLLTLLNVAQSSNCSAFVLISSDKAVNPTNVMGCTKRIGEMILAAWPGDRMRCVSVRFGNVLGSNGSAIPLFQEQIRQNQPITITHPDMTRFFMTISEAVSLVLQAFVIGRDGDILVLDMGEPVRILEVAKTLARLSGKPNQEFRFIGLRPGEKLLEELFYRDEQVLPSACPRISCTESVKLSWPALQRCLAGLHLAMSLGDRDSILAQLKRTVPEFTYEGCERIHTAGFLPTAPATAIPAIPEMLYNVWQSSPGLESVSERPGD